jgi:ubiquinone/menaquinone biosynthesis C-methylase UbiE
VQTVDPEEQRRVRLEGWAAMAPGWERAREYREKVAAPVTEWLVRELAPEPGQIVLELAAGQGDVGYAVAPLLGDEGRLISSDFSPEMVEIAQRRAFELGDLNIEHRVLDAEQLDLEDASVDGVVCRWGYMLMPHPEAALSETRRVLRAGGRLAFSVWASGDRNPWIAAAGRVLVARGLMQPPEQGEPGVFTLSDEAELRQLVEDAGFTAFRMENVPVRFDYRDVDEYVERANETGGMFSKAWATATEGEREDLKDEFRDAFAHFAVDGGYELPGLALCVVAS